MSLLSLFCKKMSEFAYYTAALRPNNVFFNFGINLFLPACFKPRFKLLMAENCQSRIKLQKVFTRATH